MSKQFNTFFLEERLRSNSGNGGQINSSNSGSSSARGIIQAWSELRDCLRNQSFQLQHLQSLKTLVNSQTSLHVADPQAKLVLSIISSQNLSLPYDSYPLFLRLVYIWVRKSFRPSSALISSAVEVVSNLFSARFESKNNPFFFSEGILLLGSLSFVPSLPEKSKVICLDLLSGLLEQGFRLLDSIKERVPDVLAGIGYALSSSVNVHYLRILHSLFRIWGEEDGPHGSLSYGLMILHLIEWVMFNFINSLSMDKINVFVQEVLKPSKVNRASFAVLMAAAGVLRALGKSVSSGLELKLISRVRNSAVVCMESLARDLISRRSGYCSIGYILEDRLLLQCVSLALTRSGQLPGNAPLFVCLALSLLNEVFPLPYLYAELLGSSHAGSDRSRLNEVKEHLQNVLFKEAGAITRVFCNQYALVDEENKVLVENLIWEYCQDIYKGHRQVALLFPSKEDELLQNTEKIAESAFFLVVVFAMAVTRHKLNSKYVQEIHKRDISVNILVSFSCVEYFRHVRLPEYMDTIRAVVANVQDNELACMSFIKSMPSYADLTNGPYFPLQQKLEYAWSRDELQTARILFFLRVIPTCIKCLPDTMFRNVVAPTMFLYMGHPSGKVARASHSLFVAFVSMGKESNQDDKVSLKEQLVFYYIERSLSGYPGITPFEGMASGIAALVRHLPAGSPAIFYCIHSLVQKAERLCSVAFTHEFDMLKLSREESEPCKKILDLLLRLLSFVDIQVLPDLMKLLAELITRLPKNAQSMVFDGLYSQVAESDDVTRKPIFVSWLQSLSYLCSQATGKNVSSRGNEIENNPTSARDMISSSWTRFNSRL